MQKSTALFVTLCAVLSIAVFMQYRRNRVLKQTAVAARDRLKNQVEKTSALQEDLHRERIRYFESMIRIAESQSDQKLDPKGPEVAAWHLAAYREQLQREESNPETESWQLKLAAMSLEELPFYIRASGSYRFDSTGRFVVSESGGDVYDWRAGELSTSKPESDPEDRSREPETENDEADISESPSHDSLGLNLTQEVVFNWSATVTDEIVASGYTDANDRLKRWVVLWDRESGQPLYPPIRGDEIHVSQDRMSFVITGYPATTNIRPGSLYALGAALFELSSGKKRGEWSYVDLVAWHPSGAVVALGNSRSEPSVTFVSASDGGQADQSVVDFGEPLTMRMGKLDSMTFSPDGSYFALTRVIGPGRDALNRSRLVSIDVFQCLKHQRKPFLSFSPSHPPTLSNVKTALQFSPDGDALLYYDKTCVIVAPLKSKRSFKFNFDGRPNRVQLERLTRWVESLTGMRVSDEGRLQTLSNLEWYSVVEELKNLGGPPLVRR